jgi:DMSO/TMAO reductase YedYZ molybdopterin-dependent catalytic subunit
MMKGFMWTRRNFLMKCLGISLSGFFSSLGGRLISVSWAKAKQLLLKGFPKEQIIHMNPRDIDNRNLEIDPLEKFGTMGPTDISIAPETYRLKLTGKVEKPLSLSIDQIKQLPPVTEVVLLICPGVFVNNGRWTGVPLKILLQEAKAKKGAQFAVIKGAQEKVVQVPLKELHQKKIFLAYGVNDATLPRKHGFPLRLVLEDHYGSEWVKYVEEIEVL